MRASTTGADNNPRGFDVEISPGHQFSPGVGVEISGEPRSGLYVPLDPSFEYGAMLVDGDVTVFDAPAEHNTLYFLGAGRGGLGLKSASGVRLLLIGGPPFGERILMWWNFVARTADEILAARRAWEKHELAADVPRYSGPRLEAPHFIGQPIGS